VEQARFANAGFAGQEQKVWASAVDVAFQFLHLRPTPRERSDPESHLIAGLLVSANPPVQSVAACCIVQSLAVSILEMQGPDQPVKRVLVRDVANATFQRADRQSADSRQFREPFLGKSSGEAKTLENRSERCA
jgi:hypothetical protein